MGTDAFSMGTDAYSMCTQRIGIRTQRIGIRTQRIGISTHSSETTFVCLEVVNTSCIFNQKRQKGVDNRF